jgi:hypothetical protein
LFENTDVDLTEQDLPEELMLKEAYVDTFKVQCCNNIDPYYEYENGPSLCVVCVIAPAASAGRLLPRCLSSFLDVLIFFTPLFSAALILFWSSESLLI